MMTTIYVPCDTTALACGADELVRYLHTHLNEANQTDAIRIVRNGSRGLFWLEPLIEVDTPKGRVGYGPVTLDALPELLAQGILDGDTSHPLYLGLVEEIPYLAKQQRLTFSRAGVIDPLSLKDYRRHGGWQGLQKAIQRSPQDIIDTVKASGLRGRGGAAFPTAIKWQTVHDVRLGEHQSSNLQKYIVCNADEGDSGTFADRLLMEADPYCLIEGMAIAGLAVGATRGYIYLREEYPNAHRILSQAITNAEQAGMLGENLMGSGHAFHLEVRLGAGAYICGEETSLLESLEGKRGLVRVKPPLPAIEGLFGQPTVVNNVLSLAAVPFILANGGEAYAQFGMGRSRGTLPFQLAGNVKHGGLVELAFGTSLRQLMEDFGGGTFSGRPLRAVQVGGPLGAYLPESQWDTELDYEAMAGIGAMLGHGGVVMFDDRVDMGEQARFAMEFCVEESCGKCTPCRIGSTRGVEVIDRIRAGHNPSDNMELLQDLCDTMVDGSLCAMGGMTPFPVRSVMQHFPQDLHPDLASQASTGSSAGAESC